jgi:hypothetical protein
MTEERTGTIEVSGGVRLFFRSRKTEGSRGRLLAVHGLSTRVATGALPPAPRRLDSTTSRSTCAGMADRPDAAVTPVPLTDS